jgi:carbon storage regulator CsrA
MLIISREVDQWIQIGDGMFVAPTDIDETGVRLIARGRMIGGEEDGATFTKAADLAVGGELRLGPTIIVTVAGVNGNKVRLAVQAPLHIGVHRKEFVDQVRRQNDE